MKVVKNPETGKTQRVEATEQEYRAANDDMTGICIRCGLEQGPVEPDAERYECEDCQMPSVYGAEQLLLMGRLTIVEAA